MLKSPEPRAPPLLLGGPSASGPALTRNSYYSASRRGRNLIQLVGDESRPRRADRVSIDRSEATSTPPSKNRHSMSTTFDFSIPEARLLLTLFPRVVRTRNSPRLPHRLTSLRIPSSLGLTNGINGAMIECVHEANQSSREIVGDHPDDLAWDSAPTPRWGAWRTSTGISAGSPEVAR
jgi:hypothetical protein